MIEYIDLKIDFAKRNDGLNGITLDRVTTRSYDTAIKFRIEIVGHALDETYDVKILSKYSYNQSQAIYKTGDNLEFLDGKLIYTPKVDLISQADYVRNYLYLSKDGLGLDMAQFNYEVDLSEIDKTALEVKLVYDESYEALIAEFEQALEDYKLTLPQASELRAEIDVILNQFGVDSQAKLNQYDADVQQAIADNQTAFGLAETGRQNTYEQAEDIRNQASNQAVVNWEQGADAIIEIVEGNESARVSAETTRKSNETDRVSSESTRKTNETTRISNENARESAEVIRLASEIDRVNAESVRVEFYEGFDGEIATLKTEVAKKANRKQEDWITPTLLNGWEHYDDNNKAKFFKDDFGIVRFKGMLKSGAVNTIAFILPVGYRISSGETAQFGTTGAGYSFAVVSTSGTGAIIPRTSLVFTLLSDIVFKAGV